MYNNTRELLEGIKDLLPKAMGVNRRGWQEMAVRAWNEYCEDFDRWDDKVLDPCLEEFENMVKRELKDGGYPGVKKFLANLADDAYWATIDSNGNAKTVTDYDLIDMLKEAEIEIEEYLKDVK